MLSKLLHPGLPGSLWSRDLLGLPLANATVLSFVAPHTVRGFRPSLEPGSFLTLTRIINLLLIVCQPLVEKNLLIFITICLK
jgi:hypothetical protein